MKCDGCIEQIMEINYHLYDGKYTDALGHILLHTKMHDTLIPAGYGTSQLVTIEELEITLLKLKSYEIVPKKEVKRIKSILVDALEYAIAYMRAYELDHVFWEDW